MLCERAGFALDQDQPNGMDVVLDTPSGGYGSADCSPYNSNNINTAADGNDGYRGKRIQHSADIEELITALGGLSLERDYWLQTAARVLSHDSQERYEGTRQFRMMLSVSGEIPIQDVIDTGIVPHLVSFISTEWSNLQFEAAWALTNIASGTCHQTEVVVQSGAIPKLIALLSNPREDIREQGMWGLGNIAGDRHEFRDQVLAYPNAIKAFIQSCHNSRRTNTIRTGVWSLSNLCRGKPRPAFHLIAPVIPYLSGILSMSEDSDTLSDACWALDGLSEQPQGVARIISSGVVTLLVRLLCHRDSIVQRPALRVIGQVAAGDTSQTQEVIDCGVLHPLLKMLDSQKKSIRKDACWTLSNIAAGSSDQVQELLNSGIFPKLMEVFQTDCESEVTKEAAWAICNACTAQKHEQLEYLISGDCIKPVCAMLCNEDPKILEIALDAIENILQFGEKMRIVMNQLTNVCVELVKANDGVHNLHNLHFIAQGHGNFDVCKKAEAIVHRYNLG